MPWKGSCIRCGHCGCDSTSSNLDGDWAPGIPNCQFEWGWQHPSEELDLIILIKNDKPSSWQHGDKDYSVTINIAANGGPSINVSAYITKLGIQKSLTDRSCPLFQKGTPNECLLYGRSQMPFSCANAPDKMGDVWNAQHAAQWGVNHPHTSQSGTCGYLWTKP